MKRLFSNATFVTMVDDVDTADALLVDDDGRIAYVGTLEEARRLAEGAEEVDLGTSCTPTCPSAPPSPRSPRR